MSYTEDPVGKKKCTFCMMYRTYRIQTKQELLIYASSTINQNSTLHVPTLKIPKCLIPYQNKYIRTNKV